MDAPEASSTQWFTLLDQERLRIYHERSLDPMATWVDMADVDLSKVRSTLPCEAAPLLGTRAGAHKHSLLQRARPWQAAERGEGLPCHPTRRHASN